MIVIVDYGVVGNIFNLKRALELFSNDVVVSSDPKDIPKASHIVLPGVGAFRAGMEGMEERNLVEPLISAIESGAPTLGICLGAQLLMERSEEMGEWKGLGVFSGPVVSLPVQGKYTVPHVGWSSICQTQGGSFEGTILSHLRSEDQMYFAHSFMIDASRDQLAFCPYGKLKFTAALKRGNIYALQFHPEKSGEAGLKILEKFVTLTEK